MHPPDCPVFEYDDHSERGLLRQRIEGLLVDLKRGQLVTYAFVADSRPSHREMFADLTPPGHDYFAGNYRGESFRCLRYYEVMIESDPRVGESAAHVANRMAALAGLIERGLRKLDQLHAASSSTPDALRILEAVTLACDVFVSFLTIHPYANGNGHVARLILWAILGRHGYWPIGWRVEPRPDDPPYSSFIERYRSGQRAPLQQWVLRFIIGPAIQPA